MSTPAARPPSLRRRVAILATLALVATAASVGPLVPAVLAADDCALAGQGFTVDAAPDEEMAATFVRYGDEKRWWTGGDSTYSVALKNGRTAWLFSDTLLGRVEEDGSQAIDKFVNSSILLEKDDRIIRTVTGGTRAVFEAAIRALGHALAPWIARFRASILVVGGSMAGSWDLVGPPLRAALVGTVAGDSQGRAAGGRSRPAPGGCRTHRGCCAGDRMEDPRTRHTGSGR